MNKNLCIITINQPNLTNFSKARNLELKKSKTPWVLFLDSDEKISSALTSEINKAIQDKNYNYQLKRHDWFLGRKLKFGETARFLSTRLVQKGTGQWHGRVHEEFKSNLPVRTLEAPLVHHRKLTLTQFIDRLNHYTSLKAQEETQFSLFKLIFYPPLKFIQNYFLRLGFLDGLPGLIMAFSMSLHSLWVRVKLYEKTV